MDILSIFFPKKCINCRKFGGYICSDCFILFDFDVPSLCGVCGRHAIGGITHPVCQGRYDIDGVFASLVYRGITKKLVYQFKFQPYLTDLRTVIGELCYEGLIQQELFSKLDKTNALFVPIPLHSKRLRERGYNQAEILAYDLSKRFMIPTKTMLKRSVQTERQVGKTQKERRENIKGAFKVVNRVEQKTVFLVDDVVTSGATMNEAAKALKRVGVKKVYGIALAHGL